MIGTLGELYVALEPFDQRAAIYVDNLPPTGLSSWRGVYAELAIETEEAEYPETVLDRRPEPFEMNMAGYGTYHGGHGRVEIKQPPTVGEFRKAQDLANGTEFEGYKGGQFIMDARTGLWVSDYGRYERKKIAGIEDLGVRVDLVTTEVDW